MTLMPYTTVRVSNPAVHAFLPETKSKANPRPALVESEWNLIQTDDLKEKNGKGSPGKRYRRRSLPQTLNGASPGRVGPTSNQSYEQFSPGPKEWGKQKWK